MVSGDLPTTTGRILAGLQRLSTFQYPDGMFAIWCGGQPGLPITSRVAHRLLGLQGLTFPMAAEMLQKTKTVLLKANHQDNNLLGLDKAFGSPMKSPEDAVAYYFAGDGNGPKQDALHLIREMVHYEGENDEKAFWQGGRAWGGKLQVTADVARLLYTANDTLFRPAFAFVTGKLVNGMLYSTADTRALVELLASLKFDPSERAIIDGTEVPLTEMSIGRKVIALNDNLIVRVDREIALNHLEPRADFQFSLEPSKTDLKIGERIQLTITPNEKTIAPLARIFLPGNLALLKAGANAQTAYVPIERDKLVVDVIAVRSGVGKLHVSVHDMYDGDKVGTLPGVEVSVND